MPFNDLEKEKILQTLEKEFWSKRRMPAHVRDQLREDQRIEGQSVELFYVRPIFGFPGKFIEEPVAKITYVASQDVWKIFWPRASGKWQGYPECPSTRTLEEALKVIDEDAYGCFFG